MPNSEIPIVWEQRAAGTIREGDRTSWGYGQLMENSYRTVSSVERVGNGIIRIRHRETDDRFYSEYAETYPVTVAVRGY